MLDLLGTYLSPFARIFCWAVSVLDDRLVMYLNLFLLLKLLLSANLVLTILRLHDLANLLLFGGQLVLFWVG